MSIAMEIEAGDFIRGFGANMLFDPQRTSQALSIALNHAARDVALPLGKRMMYSQVNFPPGYLDLPRRFEVSQFATPTRLEARITARDRATSLARFALGSPPVVSGASNRAAAKGGVTIMVRPGKVSPFPTGFLVSLKNGNVGLAVRLRPGETTLRGVTERTATVLFRNRRTGEPTVMLAYGPSVYQVFDDVRAKIAPAVADAISDEFFRQYERLTRGVQ